MALAPGTRLGPYEILSALGAGGMGEVFRARDIKLKRDVALKILPDAFANDPDRLARFQREAQVLASLNHPHIAIIHGLEESKPSNASGQAVIRALVMELVEGEDLAQRIARGPIPLDEALPIARQLAEALEAAHEQGIIHRDLKPANIKLRPDGTVKVLDFGLAKAMAVASATTTHAMNSPTVSIPFTQAGIILGTAAYMSPEQATGKPVDRRSDLWALGVVVLEMLTGRSVFTGETVSDVLVSVLKSEPDWTTLPVSTPPPIRRLLLRCLEKDRRRRLADAADARLEIDEALTAPSAAVGSEAPPEPALRPAWSHALPWALLAATGIGMIASVLAWSPWQSAPPPAVRKLVTSIGADASLPTDVGAAAILSPDGTTLAFVAQRAGQSRLFIRSLDELKAASLAGTEGAASPFFSPNGQWIAFFAGGKLKKISVTGGAPITLGDAPTGRGGTWTDDTIIFTPANATNTPLWRVSAAGGTLSTFGTLSKGAVTQRWPQVLPGPKAVVLYTEHSSGGNFDGANLVVAPLSGGMPKIVVRGGHYGRYVPSGHLIYLQQGTLFAVPFDLDRLETMGQAVPALERVIASPITGGAQLAFSSEGTLVYASRAAATAGPIDWMTRDGKTLVLRATKADWANPRFSPEGQNLALEIADGKQGDIWVYAWAQDRLTQLTFDSSQDSFPVWTPDGRRIVFSSDRAKPGINNLYWLNADGTGDVTRLTNSPDIQMASSWHPSGKFLAFSAIRGATGADVLILPMEGDATRGWTAGEPTVFLSTPAHEIYPMFSPDGRWIAYRSDEAGSNDVYVRSFPGPGGPWRVSTEGGMYPRWSTTALELLFLNLSLKVMFAPYAIAGNSFRADKPQLWSPTSLVAAGSNYPYDLHPDGKRLAVMAAQDQIDVGQDELVFVFNFFEYLRKIAPAKR
jgi:serine/threonine protein kinase/Tol biopolymer transport system component